MMKSDGDRSHCGWDVKNKRKLSSIGFCFRPATGKMGLPFTEGESWGRDRCGGCGIKGSILDI